MKNSIHINHNSTVRMNIAAISILLFLVGCSSSPTDVGEQKPVDDDPVALAWSHFAVGEFEEGLEIFLAEAEGDSNGSDPLVGMGWCYLSMDNLAEAKGVFQEILNVFQDNADAASGMAMTLSAMREHRECVKWVDFVLAIDPEYEFEYRAGINEDRLQLMAAKSWYLESRYDKCNQYLSKVGGYRTVNLSDPNLAEMLIAEIVRLEEYLG